MNNTIVVIEYNPEVKKQIGDIFESLNGSAKVVYSDCTVKGYEIIEDEDPDLIILDAGLKDDTGYDCLKKLKSSKDLSDIPVIITTEKNTAQNLKKAFDLGAQDYIPKPFKETEFKSRVIQSLSLGEKLKRIKSQIEKYELERVELERKALISNSTQNSFIIITTDGKMEWANDGFENLHGYSLSEYKNKFGSTIFSLFQEMEMVDLFNKCLRDKEPYSFISSIRSKKGDQKWLQSFISPKFNDKKEIERLVVIQNDITALKQKENELNRQNKTMLQIADKLEKANAQLESQRDEMNKQRQQLEEEQNKSEKLLLNILPFEVARQLKSKGRAGTRHYKLATVLFTDFKGFSKVSKNFEPKDLVNILDTYFVKFDEIIGKHYLEKIKTIGDAYMCVGGLPLRNRSNPVNAVLAGLEIQHYMNSLNDEKVIKNLSVWELRLGIHTGEVVAGVVGRKKFAYDIWGETVNIASRMEQAGHVGMVNISEGTYEYIKDYFECVHRGKIDAKNIGKIDMYFVNRINPELSADKLGMFPNSEFLNILNKL